MCALLWPYLVPFPAQWDSPTCCSVCPVLRHIAHALGFSQGTSRTGCGVESKGKKGDETTDAEASVCICWQYAASPAARIEMEMETRPVVSSALVKYLCCRGISGGYPIPLTFLLYCRSVSSSVLYYRVCVHRRSYNVP